MPPKLLWPSMMPGTATATAGLCPLMAIMDEEPTKDPDYTYDD